jgi:hypothetical protein
VEYIALAVGREMRKGKFSLRLTLRFARFA